MSRNFYSAPEPPRPRRTQDNRPTIDSTGLASSEVLAKLDITQYVEFERDRVASYLGQGSFGDVFKGTMNWLDDTGRVHQSPVAIKVLKCAPCDRVKIEERIRREIVTWRRVCGHRNIADFLGIHQTPGHPPNIVSRFVQINKFLEYISQHPDQKLAKAKDIARGLDHLHGNGVIHGDLTADNILISDRGDAQIIDFGISVIPAIQGFTTVVTKNVRYAAPELSPINELPTGIASIIKPTAASDIFSLGILFLQLFHGAATSTPYNHVRHRNHDSSEFRLLQRIHNGERPLRKHYNPMPDSRWALIERCWAGQPDSRPNILEVREAMRSNGF